MLRLSGKELELYGSLQGTRQFGTRQFILGFVTSALFCRFMVSENGLFL